MGFLDRFRSPAGARPAGALTIADPALEDWETVRTFAELESAQAWRAHLEEIGIDARITADQEPDRFGRGDIYLVVAPGDWSEAEAFLSNLELD